VAGRSGDGEVGGDECVQVLEGLVGVGGAVEAGGVGAAGDVGLEVAEQFGAVLADLLSPLPVICADRLPAVVTSRGSNVAASPLGSVVVVAAGGSLGIDVS